MPNYNGQGPMWGGGPQTGWGRGGCFGFRSGMGRGIGRGMFAYRQLSKEDELKMVEEYEKSLEEEKKNLLEYKKKLNQ